MTPGISVPEPKNIAAAAWAAPEVDFQPVVPGVEVLERGLALGCLALLSPVLLPVLTTTWLLSRRSPLIAHRRMGRNGEPFWMLKLRTMWDAATPGGPWRWREKLAPAPVPESKLDYDPRVTSRFAALCRKYSLDELPQLWHVVEGRMSLVGPRPLTAVELDRHYGEAAAEVLTVAPGISGLWQVMGRNRLSYGQRLRLDLFFVRKRCLGLYLAILLRTPLRVLSGKNAG